MSGIILTPRLAKVCEFVRQGAFLADVGTDHAHLPLFLLEKEKIVGAVVSDIAKGPIDRAREHIKKYPALEEKIHAVICDGLTSLEEYPITDIAICGMGGELIAYIIDRSDLAKKSGVRLILQPMTRAHKLRFYLAKRGFMIVGEGYAKEKNRIYQIICAEYTGTPYDISALNAYIGNGGGGENYKLLAQNEVKRLEREIRALELCGYECSFQKELLEKLRGETQ